MTQLPPDLEAQEEMLEHLRKLRREGWVVDKLATAPTHIAGCDDWNNNFSWYVRYNPDMKAETLGYFHLPHGVVI